MSGVQILPTFEVDKKGMGELFARKGKAFVVTELVQNAWDEATTQVDVTLEVLGNGRAKLVVEDDNPEGFADLKHAYTLFAPSAKKGDAEKRGRFNLGEKLVIAICESARITTTKGTVLFSDKGRAHTKDKRKRGSIFEGVIAMTDADVTDVERTIHTLIPPEGITTTYNHVEVARRKPLRTFTASLRTEIADGEGRLKPTTRKTTVELYEPRPGESPTVYEMGIPVVEFPPPGDRFHANIGQKVPLPLDRDNLPPAYLRHLRVEVLNHAHDLLTDDDHKAVWVTNALEDERVSPEAAQAAFTGKFGDRAVIFDPTDTEANKIAAEEGYTVIPGGSLPKGAWANIKGEGIVLPAGQVTPSPNPNEDADKIKVMDPDHVPDPVLIVVVWMKQFCERLIGGMGRQPEDAVVTWRVANDPSWPFLATYGKVGHGGRLTVNLGKLGYKWFEAKGKPVVDLAIHEVAHHYCSDHLDRAYLNALTELAALAVEIALTDPDFFEPVMDNIAAPWSAQMGAAS